AEVAPRGEAADEHLVVGGVLLHPDAIPQDRAAAEGAGGVHRQHPDLLAGHAEVGNQAIGEGGLAGPRRPGDPDHVGPAGLRKEGLQLGDGARPAIIDVTHEPRGGPDVTTEHPLGNRRTQPSVSSSGDPITWTASSETPNTPAHSAATPGNASSSKRSAQSFPSRPARSPRKVRPRTRPAANRYRRPSTASSTSSSTGEPGGIRASAPNACSSMPCRNSWGFVGATTSADPSTRPIR